MASESVQHWYLTTHALPGPLGHFNMDTLIMVWATMAVIIVTTLILKPRLQLYPTRFQTFGESLFDLCRSITTSTAGKRGDTFLFYIGSLFIFILTANILGQLPLRFIQLITHYPGGELKAATGDINTTAALAILTLVMYFFVGIRRKGFRYFLHYVHPHWAFLPINIIEDFTRPFSLMIRLFANILVGEILTSVALNLVPYVVPAGVIFLELFVAVIQAYIFAILSSVYITLLSAEEH